MNTTTLQDDSRRARRSTLWMGTGLLLALVLGLAFMGRSEPMTRGLAWAIAGVGAAGTLAMAALVRRASPYPEWALWATAGVMAAGLLASVAIAGDPAVWEDSFRPNGWMLPWFLLIMSTTPASRKGACAPAHPRAGWIMVATGTLLSVIALGAHTIVDAVARLFAG